MIESLRNDELIHSIGGRFKMCVLVQRRLRELMEGARPMVEREGRSDLELAIEEISQGKIAIEWTEAAGELEGRAEEPVL